MKTLNLITPYELIPKHIVFHCNALPNDRFEIVTFDVYDLATGYLIAEDCDFTKLSQVAQDGLYKALESKLLAVAS